MPSDARHQRDGAASGPRASGPGPLRAWVALDRDRQLAALAAVLLFITMLFPWYQQNAIVSASKTAPLVSHNLDAFAVFSFVEAAVLLVAIAVLVLLYLRAEGRAFKLPGGDGAVVFAAGLWAALLLVLRLFDKPGIAHNGVAANVGVQWGIFFALGAAGLLAYSGSRMRAARRPGPPLLREEPPARREPRRAGAREPVPPRERPDAASETPPRVPADEEVTGVPADEQATVITPRRARGGSRGATPPAKHEEPATVAEVPAPATPAGRERYPPAPRAQPRRGAPAPEHADQLSFEDSPPNGH
ncbi:MAG TPA: hypothetical protein VGL57_05605 [Solirubrobacteraceae bacterium]